MDSYPVLVPADINGDGLTDFVYEKDGSEDELRVLVNTGTGYVDELGGYRMAGYDPSNVGFRMADLNADGMADLIYESESNYIPQHKGRTNASIDPVRK